MNKFVVQTIVNLVAAGFEVKAWVDDEYFSIEDIDDYSTFSLVTFKNGISYGGIYIVAENEGLAAISDYNTVLERYIPIEGFEAVQDAPKVYSLCIVESPRESITLASVFGPKLFHTAKEARDSLFDYVTARINDNPDPFLDGDMFDNDELTTYEEIEAWFLTLNEPAKAKVIEWFFETGCDEQVLAEYIIEELEVG